MIFVKHFLGQNRFLLFSPISVVVPSLRAVGVGLRRPLAQRQRKDLLHPRGTKEGRREEVKESRRASQVRHIQNNDSDRNAHRQAMTDRQLNRIVYYFHFVNIVI